MIRFKQFLLEKAAEMMNVTTSSGRDIKIPVLKNPNFNEFLNFMGRNRELFGGLMDDSNDLYFFSSDFILHVDVKKSLGLKAKKKNFFRFTPKTLKFTLFEPSADSSAMSIKKIKPLQKMLNDRKRPFLVIDYSSDFVYLDGKKMQRDDFIEVHGDVLND